MPSFNDGLLTGEYTYNMRVADVKNQIRCELLEFAKLWPKKGKKHFKSAAVDLTLQTDVSGNVGYVGIDLKKIGLDGLAKLIATSKLLPSLGASVKWKGASKVTISFTVSVDDPNSHQKCLSPDESVGKEFQIDNRLFLAKWLANFYGNVAGSEDVEQIVFDKQFMIGVDFSTGLNPFLGTTYILPINGLNLDIFPQYTHDLKITFGAAVKPKISLRDGEKGT